MERIYKMKFTQLEIQIKLIRRLNFEISESKKCILPAMNKLKVSKKQTVLASVVTE
jgi:hypothetical protein